MLQVTDEFLEELKQKVADYSTGEKLDSDLKDILHYIPFVIQELNKEKEARMKLKSSHDKIAECWIKTLIANIELMDEHCPQWRIVAGPEIKKLKYLLRDSKGKK